MANTKKSEAVAKTEEVYTEQVKADVEHDTKKTTGTKQYIYVGATLPGISENTSITGKIPKKLDVPFVRELVIPIESFTDFLKKKAVTESREAYCYRKSVEYAKSLKK